MEPRMDFLFQNQKYASKNEMLDAIAYAYWTTGGTSSTDMVDDLIDETDVSAAAADAIDQWDLDVVKVEEGSHMSMYGYTKDDLDQALIRFIDDRPDVEADDDDYEDEMVDDESDQRVAEG